MNIDKSHIGLSRNQSIVKRVFDFSLALVCLILSWWLILGAWLVATLETRQNGFFTQERVGMFGQVFKVIKIRTMSPVLSVNTTVTTAFDPRITKAGRLFRKTKIDELPQLVNVLLGQMSFVGPRPDVPGFADRLEGNDRAVLNLRPGITGPATLKYRDEESLLAQQDDPEAYNHEVIYPDKVRINIEYIHQWCFSGDLKYIWQTIAG